MNDTALDDKIRTAFAWLEERTPAAHDVSGWIASAGSDSRRRNSTLWIGAVAAVAVAVLIGGTLVLGEATPDSASQPPPTAFVTSIPGGEIALGSVDDLRLFGFITPDGVPCLRGVPLDDSSFCSSPELWAAPGIFSWQGMWGSPHPQGLGPQTESDGWIYGLTGPGVAHVEFQFLRGSAANAAVVTHPDFEWGTYILRFNPDETGLFTVVTAYDGQGAALATYDSRDECELLSDEHIDSDQHLAALCGS